MRIAGDGCERPGTAAAKRISVDGVDLPRRRDRRTDESDHMIVPKQLVDAVRASRLEACRASLFICRIGEALGLLSLLELLLSKQRHLPGLLRIVEGDQILQRSDAKRCRAALQI